MQLSKLEIKGFKSFGDKVTINFDEGITGIVGPNGCGKSNIVDSIRWVLGEQSSRTLRSEKMENVIFNGTKKRKPTQLAEVSLTFNNTKNLLPTEYSQVSITRRYYRSGESEYLLNGVTCRLKDITNLFLDTGIASNSYAIIELKMVDDILNDKDHSRRGLFEEAAGISKFKKRKKETLKKLQDTDADLERVEDLLFEIEKNMKSLEKQAKQTEKYYQLKEEYKSLSILLARLTINKFSENYKNLGKRIEAENDKKISLNKQVSEKEASLEKAKADMILKEKALSSRQKALNEHVNKIRQYESEKKIKNERLRFLNDKSDSLKDQIEQDRKSNERAKFSLESLTQEKNAAQKILAEIEAKLGGLKEEYEIQKRKTTQIQQEVDTLRKSQKSKQEEMYQLKKSVEIKELQLSSLKQELEKTASDTNQQSASLVEFDQKVSALSEQLSVKNNQLQKLQTEETDLQSRIESTEKTIEVIREEVTQTNRKLDAKQNEYNLTKSLVESLEGFPEAIKFLKKKADWNKNAPLLSDILTCDDKYRVTIENYLEPYLNYYIVEKEEDAYEAINILSEAARGKAHFFILESFENFTPSNTTLYDNAFPATNIMEYDSKYRKLMSHILDRVYILEGDYKSIPKNDENIFITQSGKVTRRRFSISGGSVGLFEGKKIGRAKNLEKLDKEIKELSHRLDNVQQSLKDKQKDLEQFKLSTRKTDIEELREEIKLINEEYISIKTKQEQFSKMLSDADMRKEDILEKIEELTEQIAEDKPRAENEEKSQLEKEVKLNELSLELQEENEILTEKSSAFNEQNISFHQQENRVRSLEQEIEYKTDTFENSKGRIEKNQVELKENESEIRQLLDKAETNDDELVSMYEEKESIEAGVNEAEREYYNVRGQIDEVDKSVREVQRSKENIDTVLMELQNKLNETKLELNSVKERLSVEFSIKVDEIMDDDSEEPTEVSEEDLRDKVNKIKDRLDRMGPINPMAMEAYQEIKERNDFITSQREDLFNAKDSLLTTISEIDTVAKETFIDAYEKIKENFVKVFRSLFTEEDDCDLKLSDPDNPLESSIEIIAKPKGKRPLTINQLSGGEKTLTATSLLFSIYLLKPAPFCIFDEVDAPLDDANIDKFNNIIKTFSKESQFIIVTHNKRTMASTDVIYGITMIEQGVSRVIPVDLRELAD
ncbi:chromosome segregation protein SMC [Fulvivirga sediminis]|uniref:Chromosome partition protein Smc n=1 Tax=Fulvivirga sediminis TaxID=2803949 RepID=A0A937FCG2_9BACT|nr:chromosome segregation protein SMC [Fulvivirga sediminis]MBL3658649.1 chromosome segregation protein SMC [Fulvivirga sediminis]